MPSNFELQFEQLWTNYFPEIDLTAEVKLIPNRRFRFDYVHEQSKTAIELNGGNWIRGRHSRPASLIKEYEKINLAQLLGYTIFILTHEMLDFNWLEKIKNHIISR